MTETQTTEPVETGDPVAEPTSFVEDSGTFKEGWQDAYVPEDFRGRSIFNSVTSIQDVMKKMGNQKSSSPKREDGNSAFRRATQTKR